MDIAQLKASNRIIFETVAGSHAYGTATPQSDRDLRGIYINPPAEYLGLMEPSEQIGDDKSDTVYYSLLKFFRLLLNANPNIIELLWMPEDCVTVQAPLFKRLASQRNLFITQKCYHSHTGYAFAQIKKAQGQNKMINNPQPKDPPKKEDFCWIVNCHDPATVLFMRGRQSGKTLNAADIAAEALKPRMRPVPYKDQSAVDLAECHASALEHVSNTYRLYDYGSDSKGVFRDGQLVCEPISLADEVTRFADHLLIYNENEYDKALKAWHQYWDWVKVRNPERWQAQEQKGIGYDQKNIMHCVRLIMSGTHILEHGEPLVRFTGSDLQYLREIRAGEVPFATVMADAEKRMANIDEVLKTTKLPWGVDLAKVDALYRELANG